MMNQREKDELDRYITREDIPDEQDTEAERERLDKLARDPGPLGSAVCMLRQLAEHRLPERKEVTLHRAEARALLSALRHTGEGVEPVAERIGKVLEAWDGLDLSDRQFIELRDELASAVAPVPPVGMGEFEGLVDALERAATVGPRHSFEVDAARTALLDAYRRAGAVGGYEAWRVEYERLVHDYGEAVFTLAQGDHVSAKVAVDAALAALDAHVLSRPSGSGDELRELAEKLVRFYGPFDGALWMRKRTVGIVCVFCGEDVLHEDDCPAPDLTRALAVQPHQVEEPGTGDAAIAATKEPKA